MPTMVRAVMVIVLAAGTLAIAVLVWPTPYRYDHVGYGRVMLPMRTHRVTGRTEVFYPETGWTRVPPATQEPGFFDGLPSPPPPPTPSPGNFGVAECDDYVAKYLACIDGRVPEEVRSTVRKQLDATRAQWAAAASTPEGRRSLAQNCTAAAAAARDAFGCAW